MRAGLADAIHVAGHEEGYAKGSIVLCQHCLKPLYRLSRGISVGEKANRTVDAYQPVEESDIEQLTRSTGRAAGVAAVLQAWTPDQRRAHCQAIPTLRTGSPALCPFCAHSYVRVRAPEREEFIDRAYTWELFTLPPDAIAPPLVIRRWATTA